MKKTYLMVKCDLLNDAWECDADRTPLYITDKITNVPDCEFFEIYEIIDGICKLIKSYDD